MSIEDAKGVSITDYLSQRGIRIEKSGSKWFCSSPFSRDTNWSFVIYPNNTFYCWSTGRGGDIIKLVQLLEGIDFVGALRHLEATSYQKYQIDYTKFKEDEDFWKDFDYTKYLTHNENEKEAIISYGKSRSIHSGYHCGVYFTRNFESGTWIRHPSLMFLHEDKDGNIVGAKFRQIPNELNPNVGSCDKQSHSNADGTYNGPRFSMRGRPGFYILDTEIPERFTKKRAFLCESETSSNSLWNYFRDIQAPAYIFSVGGVSSPPKELPNKIRNNEISLVIDYDGDEELYQERLKLYEHLDVKPIRIILPKGEDINSLYHNGNIWKIEHLLM